MTPRTYQGGRPQRYCSANCGQIAWLSARRARELADFLYRMPRCPICWGPMTRKALTCGKRKCVFTRHNWFVRAA